MRHDVIGIETRHFLLGSLTHAAAQRGIVHQPLKCGGKCVNVLRRHKMIRRFLLDALGVSEAHAEADACRMEHILSAETMEKMYEYLEKQSVEGVREP